MPKSNFGRERRCGRELLVSFGLIALLIGAARADEERSEAVYCASRTAIVGGASNELEVPTGNRRLQVIVGQPDAVGLAFGSNYVSFSGLISGGDPGYRLGSKLPAPPNADLGIEPDIEPRTGAFWVDDPQGDGNRMVFSSPTRRARLR